MSSRDLQPWNEFPVVGEGTAARPAPPVAGGSADDNVFVFDVLRKRWWLFGICLLISVAFAYFIAVEFGSQTAVCQGALMYTGLPTPPGPAAYQPPTLMTYRQILFSTPVMQRICDQHGLGVPPMQLASFYSCQIRNGSSIMELSLSWANPEDGITMLNNTMQLLIDEASRQRKQVLGEHIRQVELAELSAKNEADNARKGLQAARRRRDQLLSVGGLTGDRYNALLERITNTQASIDALQVNRLGIEQRMGMLDTKASEIVKLLAHRQVEVRESAVQRLVRPYTKGSERWAELRDVHAKLQAIADGAPPTAQTYMKWKSGLLDIGQRVLPAAEELETTEIQKLESELRSLTADRDKLEMDLIPVGNQMALMQKRMDEYDGQAKELASDITGVTESDLEEYESKVSEADRRLQLVSQQLENMRQLEQCRTTEFSIWMPASMETTEIDSNKKKLFAVAFAALSALLCAPIFVVEWLGQRASPVARFASRWGLPVIAERMLGNYSPNNRKLVDWRLDDAVRMVTLRIQQSLMNSPGVVLVSGVGSTETPVRLIAAVAECLAQREERVLLIDAIDPSSGRTSLAVPATPEEPTGPPPATNEVVAADGADKHVAERAAGLSEYLSRKCNGVSELIQSTSCSGVDMISSGSERFPSEAMALSCMTELLEHCRKTYSIVLVAGPPAVARADFQMLAARADAILLAATRTSVLDPVSCAAVHDLIELRTPIIGIVA